MTLAQVTCNRFAGRTASKLGSTVPVRHAGGSPPLATGRGRSDSLMLKALHRNRYDARKASYAATVTAPLRSTSCWDYQHTPETWSWTYYSSYSSSGQQYKLVDGQWVNQQDGSTMPSRPRKEAVANIFSTPRQSGFGVIFEEYRKISNQIISQMSAATQQNDPVRQALRNYSTTDIDPITNRRTGSAYPRAVEWENEADITPVKSDMMLRGYASVGIHPDEHTAIVRDLEDKIQAKDPYSKQPQGMQTNFSDEAVQGEKLSKDIQQATAKVPEQDIDISGFSRKPTGMETAFAEEDSDTLAQELTADPAPLRGQVDRHGYDYVPTGMQTSFENEPHGDESVAPAQSEIAAEQSPASTDSYSKTPQGLETAFAREADFTPVMEPVEQAPAPTDSYSTKPQGIETQYQQEASAASAKSSTGTLEQELLQKLKLAESNPTPVENGVEPFKVLSIQDGAVTATDVKYRPDNAASPVLSLPEALPKLNDPLRFLSQLEALSAEGWGIAHAQGDLLILKRVPEAIITQELGMLNKPAQAAVAV